MVRKYCWFISILQNETVDGRTGANTAS